ncbi:MAG: hypothetical protein ABTQ34_03325 [Bdellovibrionales bacterium]
MTEKKYELSCSGRKILRLIDKASAPNGLRRWEGLRSLDYQTKKQPLFIPLDQDGNLRQQYNGLKNWCQRFSLRHSFNWRDAAIISLAYVARQLGHQNVLVDRVTENVRIKEQRNLIWISANILTDRDRKTRELFGLVAESLTNHNMNSPTYRLLRMANAAFYIETGVSALLWAREDDKIWLESLNARKSLHPVILSSACRSAQLVAANAYGNHANILDRDVLAEIIKPLTPEERDCMASHDFYLLSQEASRQSTPSRDPITDFNNKPPAAPPKLQQFRPQASPSQRMATTLA